MHSEVVSMLERAIEAESGLRTPQELKRLAANLEKMVRTYHHDCSGLDGPKKYTGIDSYDWGDLEFVNQFTSTQMFTGYIEELIRRFI